MSLRLAADVKRGRGLWGTTIRCLSAKLQVEKSVTKTFGGPQATSVSDNVDDGGLLPDGRKYVVWKGKKYPIRWRSELEEGGLEKIEQWIKEGKWNSRFNRPVLLQKESFEKAKMWQIYNEMHQDRPIYNRYAHDRYWIPSACWVIVVLATLNSIYCYWNIVAPPALVESYKFRDKSHEKSYT